MNRIPSLDGLRAYSVALVVLGHLATRQVTPSRFGVYAGFGVEVFFVISGFIITRILLLEHESTGFYKKRFFRIVPAAYLYIGAILATHWHQFSFTNIATALSFTVNYDIHRQPVAAHLWSLGVEEQFYLLWPLILVAFFRQRTKILVTALCLSPFMPHLLRYFTWTAPYADFSFLAQYDLLALGCLGAVLYNRLPALRSPWLLLCGVAAVLFRWPLWAIPGLERLSALGHLWPLAHLCLAAFVLHVTHHRYVLLNLAPVVWLGTISYGIYLWQQVFILSPVPQWAPLFTLMAACVSYYGMERPLMRRYRRGSSSLARGKPGELASAAGAN